MRVELLQGLVDYLKFSIASWENRVYLDSPALELSGIERPFACVRLLSSARATLSFAASDEPMAESFLVWVYIFCRPPDSGGYEFIALPETVLTALTGQEIALKDNNGIIQAQARFSRFTAHTVGSSGSEEALWNYCTVIKGEALLYRAKNSAW